jgi:lysophospholipase L1-like esterase
LFPPIHPIAYTHFSQKEHFRLETTTKRLADSLQIAYIGSFNPFLFGLDKIEKPFIDEIHLSPAGLQQVLLQKIP